MKEVVAVVRPSPFPFPPFLPKKKFSKRTDHISKVPKNKYVTKERVNKCEKVGRLHLQKVRIVEEARGMWLTLSPCGDMA